MVSRGLSQNETYTEKQPGRIAITLWVIALAFISLFVGVFVAEPTDNMARLWGRIIGGAAATFVFPGIVASVQLGIRKWRKKPNTTRRFLWTYTIWWCIFAFLNVLAKMNTLMREAGLMPSI